MNRLYNEYVDKEQQVVDMYYDSNGYSAKEWRNSLIKEPLTKEEICHSEEDFEYFYDNLALGVLLINEVIIINNFFWKTEWPIEAQQQTALSVCCNDVFDYACADAEEMLYSELSELWKLYLLDNVLGPVVWCCLKRKQLPLREWYIQIQASGYWDLDKIDLSPNSNWK